MEDVILGTETLLFVDVDTPITTPIEDVVVPGTFEEIICLTDNSFDATTASIQTDNKCNGLWDSSLPGLKSATFGGNGDAVLIDGADPRYNMDKVAELWRNGTRAWWLQYNPNGAGVRFAVGYVSSYNDTSPNKDKQTFSFTITLTGSVATAYPTTS